MNDTCQQVEERLASDQPLGRLRDHIELCPNCAELAKVPRLLAEVSHARKSVEPAPGYASRLAARAMSRGRTDNSRGRKALVGLSLAGAIGVGIAAFALTSSQSAPSSPEQRHAANYPAAVNPAPAPVIASAQPASPTPDDTKLVGELADITDPDRALSFSAEWSVIEEKIAAADVLLGTEDPQ